MGKFPIHTPDSPPEASRSILRDIRAAYGFLPNVVGVLAESPAALAMYRAAGQALEANAGLGTIERNLVMLVISVTNHCDYCTAVHTGICLMQKVPETHVEAIREGRPLDDPRLEALRRFTEAVVAERGWAGDAALNAFFEADFTQADALEVVALVAFKTLTNYTNHLAHTPVDGMFARHRVERD